MLVIALTVEKLSERPPESDTESTSPREILLSFVLAGYEDRCVALTSHATDIDC